MTTPYLSCFGFDVADTDMAERLDADESARCFIDDYFALSLPKRERFYRTATPDERDLIDRATAIETAAALAWADEQIETATVERAA